ncbi:MAG: phage holin, family [Anaerocolumna sp.]|jgi:LL-H family phage holin|nr:phage holin, family [Anaerocolumna sp.]
MNETLFTIIKYTIGILALVVFRYIIPFVKLKLENSKYADVLDFIEKCVNAAESIYKNIPKSGEEKKAYVIDAISHYATQKGIKITQEQIDILIEGLVTELSGYTINKK